jgi:hypothetical protein
LQFSSRYLRLCCWSEVLILARVGFIFARLARATCLNAERPTRFRLPKGTARVGERLDWRRSWSHRHEYLWFVFERTRYWAPLFPFSIFPSSDRLPCICPTPSPTIRSPACSGVVETGVLRTVYEVQRLAPTESLTPRHPQGWAAAAAHAMID